MKKLIAIIALGATLSGCQMTPEQRQALGGALRAMAQAANQQAAYHNQQAEYWRQYSQNALQPDPNEKLQNDICAIRRAQGSPYIVGAPGGC